MSNDAEDIAERGELFSECKEYVSRLRFMKYANVILSAIMTTKFAAEMYVSLNMYSGPNYSRIEFDGSGVGLVSLVGAVATAGFAVSFHRKQRVVQRDLESIEQKLYISPRDSPL